MSYLSNNVISGDNNSFVDYIDVSGAINIPESHILLYSNGNIIGRLTEKGYALVDETTGIFIKKNENLYGVLRTSDLHTNRKNLCLGIHAGEALFELSAYSGNLLLGYNTGANLQGNDCLFIGNEIGSLMSSHSASCVIGHNNADGVTVVTRSIVLGHNSIRNDLNIQDKFIVDYGDHGTNGAENNALIYSDFADSVPAQVFRVNAGQTIFYGGYLGYPYIRLMNSSTGTSSNDGSYLSLDSTANLMINQQETNKGIALQYNGDTKFLMNPLDREFILAYPLKFAHTSGASVSASFGNLYFKSDSLPYFSDQTGREFGVASPETYTVKQDGCNDVAILNGVDFYYTLLATKTHTISKVLLTVLTLGTATTVKCTLYNNSKTTVLAEMTTGATPTTTGFLTCTFNSTYKLTAGNAYVLGIAGVNGTSQFFLKNNGFNNANWQTSGINTSGTPRTPGNIPTSATPYVYSAILL